MTAAILRVSTPLLRLLVFSLAAGVLGALGASLFRETLLATEHFLYPSFAGLVASAQALPWWQRAFYPLLGGLLGGTILQLAATWIKGKPTSDYLEAIRLGSGEIGLKATLMRSASSLCSVVSGGSIGREGSMVQISAMVGSQVADRVGLTPQEQHIMVAGAAAAGLATAYNAPIAAAIFVGELALDSIKMGKLATVLLAASVGNALAHRIFGATPIFLMPSTPLPTGWDLPAGLLCGLAAGLLVPCYLSTLSRVKAGFRKLPSSLILRLGLGGALVGLLSIPEPGVWGNGYSSVHSLLHEQWAWTAVASLLIIKILATAITTGSGAVGGVFTPTILVGTCTGYLVGLATNAVATGAPTPMSFAAIGAGAVLAGATHAPVMAILMILEMTGRQTLTVALTTAAVIAHVMACSIRKDSLYSDSHPAQPAAAAVTVAAVLAPRLDTEPTTGPGEAES